MYRSVLESDPNNATANHNLGVIELSKSSSESAIPYFRNAVESRPEVTQYWLSYIEALTLNMGANVRCVRKAIDDARKYGADERQLQSAEDRIVSCIEAQRNLPTKDFYNRDFNAFNVIEFEFDEKILDKLKEVT